MASTAVHGGRKGTGMPATLSFVLGTAGVLVVVWLAWSALTTDSVPLVGSVRNALIGITIVGMAACAVGGIGQAPIIGWGHPITLFGIVVGVLALLVAAAGLLGWDALVSPFAGLVPVGSALLVSTERVAIGLLTALIVVKWAIGIPLTMLATH